MKTAGLVLDFYDDASGELLKKAFPTAESLPEVVKTAHILSTEERDVLRDEAFALILMNEGKALRKFACVDAGNTLLSALYFMEHKDVLPEEAQKIASANIISAAEEFGLPIRDLEKIASEKPPTGSTKGAARSRDPMRGPMVGDDADWAQRTNLNSIRGGADSGRVIPTASQLKTAGTKDEKKKTASPTFSSREEAQAYARGLNSIINEAYEKGEVVGAPKGEKSPFASKKKKGEKVDFLDSHHKLNPGSKPMEKKCSKCGSTSNDMRGNICDKCAFPKKKVANVIDVSNLSAPVLVKKASASRFALDDRYSLDSFADVQKAIQYFSDYNIQFVPRERHEFAVKTAARAEELGIQTTDLLDRYGSTEYAPDVEGHLAIRRAHAPEFKEVWDTLQEKRASIDPEKFAELLAEADVEAGLDWHYGGEIQDPYFVTFGGNSAKQASAAWNWQSSTGDYVSADQLKRLALNGRPLVAKQFEPALAAAFSKDPIAIFESLPELQKGILARLAAQEFDGLPTN